MRCRVFFFVWERHAGDTRTLERVWCGHRGAAGDEGEDEGAAGREREGGEEGVWENAAQRPSRLSLLQFFHFSQQHASMCVCLQTRTNRSFRATRLGG